MNRQALLISLIDPVITTADAATASAPEALPFIPGAMLHGVAASQGYRDPSLSSEMFKLFHDGAVRFGDGFPVDADGSVGFPAPMSLQAKKGELSLTENLHDPAASRYLADGVEDFAARDRDNQQWKSVGGGALASDRKFIDVRRSTTMRTAIDPDAGRAADSQLFSYESLDAGQRFVAVVDADSEHDLERIIPLLTGQRILGRSKSAEFGRVQIERVDTDFGIAPAGGGAKETLYVWFLSDLWAQSHSGQPGVRPDPQQMGFGASAEIDWNHSFIHTRRVSPFNAHWKMRGLEREVIQRGSVLTITDTDSEHLCGLRHFGFGTEFGSGFAAVSKDPPLGMLQRMTCSVEIKNSDANQSAARSETPLSAWLARRIGTSKPRVSPQELADDLYARYAEAKNWHGKSVGPSPSQWGALRTILEANGDISTVIGDADDRDEREAWNARFSKGPEGTFAGWVRAGLKDKEVSNAVLATAARNIRDRLKREPANG